jgi:putative redox protein
MEVTIRHLGDVKFEAEARGHRVVCDQPADNHGTDQGMTPPEFLLASLGTCAGFYAAQYLKTRSLSTKGLEVKVHAEKALRPARLAAFRIEVVAPEVPEEHEAGLLRAVDTCLIRNTLLNTPTVETVVRSCAAVK